MGDKSLNVFLNDVLVGKLSNNSSAELSFKYDKDYLASSTASVLSISMPLTDKPFEDDITEAFFANLLPDAQFKRRLAKYLGRSEGNTFGLLEEIGRECAGAVSLYPDDEQPETPKENDYELLDEQKLKELLELMKIKPLLANYNGVCLSLAGAQNKMAIGLQNGQTVLVKGGAPTTHILKPMIDFPDVTDSVQNEFFCMKLAGNVGLAVPEVQMLHVGEVPCYLIERYDRKIVNGRIQRIHQEDFCQAMGLHPELKYEVDGGPKISDCLKILEGYSAQPVDDSDRFLKMIIFNYLVGNSDAHGKNFSLLHTKNGLRLSPAYDLMSTAAYPILDTRLAMKIGGEDRPSEIYQEHWMNLVPAKAVSRKLFKQQLQKMKKAVFTEAQKLTDEMKRSDFPSPVYEKICSMVRQRSECMEREIGLSR